MKSPALPRSLAALSAVAVLATLLYSPQTPGAESPDRPAAGSGTTTLVFQYSVQVGLNDADGIAVTGLVANGGSLRDAAGNAMNLALNNVGSTAGVVVDTTAPAPTAIITLDPSPTNAGSVRYTLTFSEDVSGVDLSDFSLVISE